MNNHETLIEGGWKCHAEHPGMYFKTPYTLTRTGLTWKLSGLGAWAMFPTLEDAMSKTKHTLRPDLTLLPWKALQKLGMLMARFKGSRKDWRGDPVHMEKTMRHLSQHLAGELIDEESGMSHLTHAACRLLMALEDER